MESNKSRTMPSMKLRSQIMRPGGILALGFILVGASLFAIPQAHAQSDSTDSLQAVTATTSVSSQVELKPVGFFEKVKLFFTVNPEKKADLLQDFSARNFELAKEKLEAGQSDEANLYFKKSDEDVVKATTSISKIENEERQKEELSSISATASNRTTVLTSVQAKVENPVAKAAIANAIANQAEVKSSVDMKIQSLLNRIADLEAKIKELESKNNAGATSASDNASVKAGATVNGSALISPSANVKPSVKVNTNMIVSDDVSSMEMTASLCTSSSMPSILVISPNGGESYDAGEPISVTWTSCNVAPDSMLEINVYSKSPQVFGFFAEHGTENDGSETIDSESLPAGSNYEVIVGVPRGGFDNSALSVSDKSDTTFSIEE